MYDYFKGTLAFLRTDAAVVECGGVGYRLAVSASTHAKLSPLLVICISEISEVARSVKSAVCCL